jgi:hypothetical protein
MFHCYVNVAVITITMCIIIIIIIIIIFGRNYLSTNYISITFGGNGLEVLHSFYVYNCWLKASK